MTQRLSIRLHEVSVRRGRRWVLKNISWNLCRGERWVLTGVNGAGKTQLLKVLAADVWPTPTGREAIEYRLEQSHLVTRARSPRLIATAGAARLASADAKRLIAYLGAERQDRYARYGWNMSVRDLLATGIHGTDILLEPVTLAQRRQITRMLRTCSLSPLTERRFLSLSYGQQRLALLARALIGTPHWLLLDEFYNGLDRRYRHKVDTILAKAARAGQSWVVTAHRSMDVPHRTTRWLRLERGRVVCNQRISARALKALDIPNEPAVSAAHGAPQEPRAPIDAFEGRAYRSAEKDLLIRVSDANLYVNYHRVLNGVNWELRRGEHWAVIGENGAGKSSFLKMLYGDLAPAQGGRIERAGMMRGDPIEDWKRRVAYISADLQSDYAIDSTIEELVASGRHSSVGLNEPMSREDRRVARQWLRHFRLGPQARAKPRELSYGQLRRALFARAMATDAEVVLFDEPLTGLDPLERSSMRMLLGDLMKRDVSIVLAVHHWEDLPAGITHRLLLHKRRAHAQFLINPT